MATRVSERSAINLSFAGVVGDSVRPDMMTDVALFHKGNVLGVDVPHLYSGHRFRITASDLSITTIIIEHENDTTGNDLQ